MIAIQKIDILRACFEHFPIVFIKGFGSKFVMQNDEISTPRSRTRCKTDFFCSKLFHPTMSATPDLILRVNGQVLRSANMQVLCSANTEGLCSANSQALCSVNSKRNGTKIGGN